MLMYLVHVVIKGYTHAQGLGLNLDHVDVLGLSCHRLKDFEWPVLSLGTMVSSRTGLWSSAMSGSVTLIHPGSVLMFLASETIKVCAFASGQRLHLGPSMLVPLGHSETRSTRVA